MTDRVTVSEPKARGVYKVRAMRKRRKVAGEIVSYRKGLVVLQIKADLGAWRESAKAWRVDYEVLREARAFGLTHVRLMLQDGRQLLTPLSSFDPNLAQIEVSDPKQSWQAAERRWLVPHSLWVSNQPAPVERAQTLMGLMKIGARA